MSSIVVSELDHAHPGEDSLLFDISFGVSPGDHAAIVGTNGVGKSTILRILSGDLAPDGGEYFVGGTVLSMTQDVGMSRPDDTLREMLIDVAPPAYSTLSRAVRKHDWRFSASNSRATTFCYSMSQPTTWTLTRRMLSKEPSTALSGRCLR